MRALDRKLFRDLARLWAQALAIALVVAGGVATLVLAVGSFRSLEETRNAYYERYRFADVFATVRRAPKTLVSQIAEIPGVAAVDARIAKLALLDIPDFREPATGHFISLPDVAKPALNQLYMRVGRTPEALSPDEVVVSEGFAKAHGFLPGARFSAILNGRKRQLTIVGIALSPEFIYTVGSGDIMPDGRHFAIVWMSENALASAYDVDAVLSILAAIVCAIRALWDVVRLPPAVAMQPPAPPRFWRLLPSAFALDKLFSQPAVMMLRNIARHPIRAGFTVLGMALATAILIVSLFTRDTMEELVNVTYFLSDRQDATISFVEKRAQDVVMQVARLPGVLAVEPYR